ncbi:MAG: GNAT family N-acetyltransferase [Acidimicrobiales bacterium]
MNARRHIPTGDDGSLPERLARHLDEWLGQWRPPGEGELIVVGSEKRTQPGWDGTIRPFVGIETLSGAVLSVPPERVAAVRALGDDLDTVGARLGDALGLIDHRFGRGIYRWSTNPAPPDPNRLGLWLPTTDPRVLPWLRPFNGDVLVGFDAPDLASGTSQVAAGVGRKQHDQHGHELAVVTEEGHRGKGWAASLVSQAARRVLDDRAIPIYLHAPDNRASAKTADACGFPDRGWRILGLFRT